MEIENKNQVSDKIYTSEQVASKVVKYLLSTRKKFLFISGNGGSGKTELSKAILRLMSKQGRVNLLEMDDFVVSTELRNNSIVTWKNSEGINQKGRYTTSFEESYFLQSVNAIIHNLEKKNNYYHWPKKAKNGKDCRLLYGNAILNIFEGVGTVFFEKE